MFFTTNRRLTSSRSRGFTIIELLVVISIVSLLISILLPAIQAARETARTIDCRNNIKQLAIACHSHNDVHGHFPTGGWGWYWVGDADRGFGKKQPGGWIYNLLPYFEQYTIYGKSSDGNPNKLTGTQRIGAAKVIQTPLSVINCPSRRTNQLYPLSAAEGDGLGYFNSVDIHMAGRSDYAINSGHVYNEWPNKHLGQGPSDYSDAIIWDSQGLWGGEQPELFRSSNGTLNMTGISYERSTVSIAQITDGTSKTYLLGEKHIPVVHYLSGLHYGDNETWCTGFNNDNYRRTGRLVEGDVVESLPISDFKKGYDLSWGRFGSAHATGWNVAFCDGSVQQITFEIDWQVHRDFGNREDSNLSHQEYLFSY